LARFDPRATPSARPGFFTQALAAFQDAMDDDLNTAGALDPLNQACKRANELCEARKPDATAVLAARDAFDRMASVTGVAEGDPETFFARVTARRVAQRGLDPARINTLVAE